MGSVTNGCSSPVFPSPLNFLENKAFFHKKSFCNLIISNKSSGRNGIFCKISGTGVGEDPGKTSKSRTEDYNTAMKNMMRNPYEYHHDLGKFFMIPFQFHLYSLHLFVLIDGFEFMGTFFFGMVCYLFIFLLVL